MAVSHTVVLTVDFAQASGQATQLALNYDNFYLGLA
jgi:hypothetical protein